MKRVAVLKCKDYSPLRGSPYGSLSPSTKVPTLKLPSVAYRTLSIGSRLRFPCYKNPKGPPLASLLGFMAGEDWSVA